MRIYLENVKIYLRNSSYEMIFSRRYSISLVHFSRYLCVSLTETITCFASRKISVAPLALNPLGLALVVSRKAKVVSLNSRVFLLLRYASFLVFE